MHVERIGSEERIRVICMKLSIFIEKVERILSDPFHFRCFFSDFQGHSKAVPTPPTNSFSHPEPQHFLFQKYCVILRLLLLNNLYFDKPAIV